MVKVNPVIAILVLLSIISPASVKEIEAHAKILYGEDWASFARERKLFPRALETALDLSLVKKLRNRKIVLTLKGIEYVKTARMRDSVLEKRIFRLKHLRKSSK